jgi:hypothetical protein
MCRIKKENNQFKSSRRDDKIEDESSITEEVTLMIKRCIDEIELVESSEFLAHGSAIEGTALALPKGKALMYLVQASS